MSVYNFEFADLVDKITIGTSKKKHYDIFQEAFFEALDKIQKEEKNEN